MATTTNYSWTTPDDTSLVKDGAAAIRTLGSSIDTTTKNLNPQTTTGAIAYRSATSNVNTALPIGTAGQVLTVNSGATAPEWATPAAGGGGMTLLQSLSLSGASVTSSTFTPADYISYYVVISDAYAAGNSALQLRLNGDTNNNYWRSTTAVNDTSVAGSRTSAGNVFLLGTLGALTANGEKGYGAITINRINDTTEVFIESSLYASLSSGADVRANWTMGTFNNTTAISSITLLSANFNFSAGTAYIYGVK